MDTKKLIDTLGISGVHIDLEYISNSTKMLNNYMISRNFLEEDEEEYGQNVNSFHKKLRALLPNSFISSVVVATSPDTKPWKRKTTMEELSVLVRHVDQLSFLYYDTYISSQDIFERNCVSQIEDIKDLKEKNPDIQYLISIGTFINGPELQKYRNLEVESISNTLEVIKKSAVTVSPTKKLIDGISIYCDWETDTKEWKDFRSSW